MTTSILLRDSVPAPLPGRVIIAVNRYARGVHEPAVRHVVAALGHRDIAVREIGGAVAARDIAADAVADRAACLVAVGGDGTVHELLQPLAGASTALGIVPLGTSNDLARRLGIPLELNRALDVLRAGVPEAVDLLAVNGVRVATAGGFGLPAHIARAANRWRGHRRLGPIARGLGRAIYTVAAAERIAARRVQYPRLHLRVDGEHLGTMAVPAVLVGLVERFGGGLRLAPPGGVAAGRFALAVMTATDRVGLLRTLLRMRTHRPLDGLARIFPAASRLEIRSTALVGAFGDGEWLGVTHRADVTVERAALRVVRAAFTGARGASLTGPAAAC